MNPLHLRARSYRTFDELDLDLPDGVCAIIGENGAGKSSIVNLVDLALFGPESRSLADQLTDDGGSDDLMIELEFEHADRMYRVRRSYNARGRGSTKVDFERYQFQPDWQVGDAKYEQWEPLTRESAAATQDAICQLIGLTRATFRASAFLAQSDGAAFTEAQPRERKRILGEVLGLDKWDVLCDLVKRDRRTSEGELARIGGRLGAIEDELDKRPQVVEQLAETADREIAAQDQLADADRELAQVTERYTAARETAAAREAAELLARDRRAAWETAGQRLVEIELELRARETVHAQLAEADRVGGLVGQLSEALDRARAGAEARAEYDRLVRERARVLEDALALYMKARALREQADHVLADTGDAECDRCGQTLGAEAAKRAAASFRTEADQLDRQAQQNDEQALALLASLGELEETVEHAPTPDTLAELDRELSRARDAQLTAAQLRARLERLDELGKEQATLAAGHAELQTAWQEAEQALTRLAAVDLNGLEVEGTIARSRAEQARTLLDTARNDRARLEATRDRLDAAAREAEQLQRARAELHTEVDLLAQLERAFGRDGIPALIVENAAIPQIEVEASRILAELGTPYRVELRTERALKSGDGLRDTLDVVVVGESGEERAFETFSGGERSRLNVALRIALARLLAHRRGAESRLLALDEVEYLDENGHARLAEVLHGLQGEFDKIILVSHAAGLRDAFDTTLTVVKENGRSRVLEAGDRVEVAA